MKKGLRVIVATMLVLSMSTGCGVKQEEYDRLMAEKEAVVAEYDAKIEELNSNIENLQMTIDNLELTIADQETVIDELENGEDRKYTEIRNLYEANKHDEVIEKAKAFHEEYNGSQRDAEVQELAKSSQAELDRIAEEKRKADEAAAAEARKSAEEKAREIIRVSKVAVSRPDSAGGVKLYINFKNNSDKTIKYVDFKVAMYNAVGDIDLGEYEYGSYVSCRSTGPFNKGQGLSGTNYYWGKYYSYQIKSAKLLGVSIEYMDGSKRTLNASEVEYVQY